MKILYPQSDEATISRNIYEVYFCTSSYLRTQQLHGLPTTIQLSAKQIQKLQINGFALNYRNPATYEIWSYAFRNLWIFQKVSKNNILQTHVECHLVAMKAQRDEGGGRILLGVTHVPGRSCGGRSVSIVLECVFQLDSLLYMYIWPYLYSIATGAGPCGKQLLCQAGGFVQSVTLI
jgi:hypothetical protein